MLPDHLGDLPPAAAMLLEKARRRALDWLFAHDYHLLNPPLAEHLDTLTAGSEDLELNTFKMTDTMSGRTLGIRADHTPQVLRFDADTNGAEAGGVSRYCYFGPILMTKPPQPWQWREELQLGAEMFRSPTPAGDWEMARLAAGALKATGLRDFCADLGHAGIVKQLLNDANVPAAAQAEILRHFSKRDSQAMRLVAAGSGDLEPLILLSQINGDISATDEALKLLPQFAAELEVLRVVAEQLSQDGCDVGVDFSEIGGYGYHTGAVFVFYGDGFVAARGGRYNRNGTTDDAVGFSMNMREIVAHLPAEEEDTAVAVPLATGDKKWQAALAKLHTAGRRVRFLATGEKPTVPCLENTAAGVWEVREK